ncbi:MAG: hypothetical protein J0I82_02495 [Spirosoma sp.]|uniref:hypothetical protein n=1 Tax=unclassified Spirosoma TaxID=2621999 RepID=UPI0009590717|nr:MULTISPECIES: hypothetical protein [unclassified Spirosoma]MBN8820867.1 hypothetical protein [Spirosoma sp.]OJW77873.1 MAG: hypothetical protein BGO59_23955 [Spirosoma sp. 48-14]
MRHPIEKYNQQQEATLASLPEAEREWTARMFRIGNATYSYYNKVKELTVFEQPDNQSVASSEDLLDWLERQLAGQAESRSARELLQIYFEEYLDGLPHEGLRRAEQAGGLDKAKKSFPFRRYVLERHDIGMDEFLRMNLSAEDYTFYLASSNPTTEGHEPDQ